MKFVTPQKSKPIVQAHWAIQKILIADKTSLLFRNPLHATIVFSFFPRASDFSKWRRIILLTCLLCLDMAALQLHQQAYAEEVQYHFDGHVKGRIIGLDFPQNSFFTDLTDSNSLDSETDLRLNVEANQGAWSAQASYQYFTLYGDRIEYSRQLPASNVLFFDRFVNDSRRLFDLTDVIEDDRKLATLHRLDRLWFGYSGQNTILRFGRQAISWGNGFFFSPMDIINPFDPAAIDTEYKTGDDMLYGQYLTNNGDDIQGAIVFRRNTTTDNVKSEESTYSLKYHGIAGGHEFDLLLAQSYDNLIVGIGGNLDIGGAVWRGDLVITDAEFSTQTQGVTNLSYSWRWLGKNISGVVEYYYNGFGQSGADYSPQSLAANPDLLHGLSRSELFTLGKHYLAAGASIELTPLWILTPNLFSNLKDNSALLQVVTQNNLSNNLTFLGAFNLPIGSDGSEYGGIETGAENQFFSNNFSLFTQLGWYF